MLKHLKRAAFIFLLIIIGWYIFLGTSIYRFSKKSYDTKSDVAIVLGAAVWDSVPSPVFRERINHGIQLLNDGLVDYIIFTGGKGDEKRRAEARAARNYALVKGIPEKKIFLEDSSRITYYNLIYAIKIMEQNNFKTALIVSDPLHMKRSLAMCKKLNIDARPSPTPTTMYRSFGPKLRSLLYEVTFYTGGIFAGHLDL